MTLAYMLRKKSGGTVAQRLAQLPHKKVVLGLGHGPDPNCMEIACLPGVFVGFLQVLQFSSTAKTWSPVITYEN